MTKANAGSQVERIAINALGQIQRSIIEGFGKEILRGMVKAALEHIAVVRDQASGAACEGVYIRYEGPPGFGKPIFGHCAGCPGCRGTQPTADPAREEK